MSGKQYLSSEERRERTVEAVINLCSKGDPATITTEEIAGHMRVTQGALFRHFPNKEAIWEAVVAWVAGRISDRVFAAGEGIEDPLEALEAIFLAHVDFIARHPGVPRVLIGQLQHSRSTPAKRMVRSMLEGYRQRIAALLQQAQKAQALRPGISVEAAAIQFIGTLQGLVLQSLIADKVPRIVVQARAAFDIYLNGIRAGPGGKR
jgi:TetR/AcrR family transcriptional regulator